MKRSCKEQTFSPCKAVVALHKEPLQESPVVSEALFGEKLLFHELKDQWAYCEGEDHYKGWVRLTELQECTKKAANSWITSVWAHVYQEKDTEPSPPFITLSFGTKVFVVEGDDPRWLSVEIHGEQQWIQRGDLSFLPKDVMTVEQMIALAKKFCGLPYRWGGRSGFGFDCSGFVQMLFSQVGVMLPRDSSLQYMVGKNVEGVRKTCDLVFFGKENVVNHVGLITEASSGLFIHSCTTDAPLPPGIKISHLEDPFWKNKLIGVKRVL